MSTDDSLEESDEKASHPAVPVEEGMDRLELDVSHPGLHEHRKRRLVVVQEPLEGCHALLDLLVRGRDKEGLTRPGPPDPVLRPSELAGGLIAPSTVREKD